MPACLILNNEILNRSSQPPGGLPTPFMAQASKLQFSNIMINGSMRIGYRLVSYQGRPIAIFGQAPDYNFEMTSEELKQLYATYNIKRIYCLDQRRNQCLTPELKQKAAALPNDDCKPEWFNVHYYETSFNVPIYNAFDGIRFDLADKFEVCIDAWSYTEREQYNHSLAGLKPTYFGNAIQPTTDAIRKLRRELFRSHSSNAHYGDHSTYAAKQFVDQLRFYPAPCELEAFINSMHEAYQTQEVPIVYCAGGLGRTALYLAFWLRNVCRCSLMQALNIVSKEFIAAQLREIYSSLQYMKYQLPDTQRTALQNYCTSTNYPWQDAGLLQKKQAIATELLKEDYINYNVVTRYLRRVSELNLQHHKPPENGRLYQLINKVADDIGMNPQSFFAPEAV